MSFFSASRFDGCDTIFGWIYEDKHEHHHPPVVGWPKGGDSGYIYFAKHMPMRFNGLFNIIMNGSVLYDSHWIFFSLAAWPHFLRSPWCLLARFRYSLNGKCTTWICWWWSSSGGLIAGTLMEMYSAQMCALRTEKGFSFIICVVARGGSSWRVIQYLERVTSMGYFVCWRMNPHHVEQFMNWLNRVLLWNCGEGCGFYLVEWFVNIGLWRLVTRPLYTLRLSDKVWAFVFHIVLTLLRLF